MISLVLFVSSSPPPLHLLNCAFVLPILLPSHSGEGAGSEVLWGCLAAGQGLYTTHMELQKVRVAQFKKPFTLYGRKILQVCREVPYLRC